MIAPRRSAYDASRGAARDQPQPHLPDRGGHLVRAGDDVELADQPEVDVDEPVVLELDEQVLAGGVGAR